MVTSSKFELQKQKEKRLKEESEKIKKTIIYKPSDL